MTEETKDLLVKPKLRSQKWISTAILDTNSLIDQNLKYASAEYFVHNLINPVYFHNKLSTCVPSDAVIIEIGPTALFEKIVNKTLVDSTYMSLIRREKTEQNLNNFLITIANLYELGLNPAIENLYPKVEWPVPRGTPSISSIWHWHYNQDYAVRKYPEHYMRFSSSDMNVTIDLSQPYDHYLSDHCIDGNVLFPATGYLMLAWRQLAASSGRIWNQIPVIFEEVEIRRPVFLSEDHKSQLKINLHKTTGILCLN